MSLTIPGGLAHELPEDLREALAADPEALAAWLSLTPLARNEWICWTISVKRPETRREHLERLRSELREGIRRPCCWMGCVHRTDKALSPSQSYILGKEPEGSEGARASSGRRSGAGRAQRARPPRQASRAPKSETFE